ncbi:acyl-CoA dehydrogenase family protein [Streptomyces sp. I05A-00742]|uniref:acyl-CoA dehydrogenase family protein n=1 Tax=Streptomyces sp. I05A-00742 TaxID=2732853 RepID=UPI001488C297|nr:acyl-CoA dehydrogenase family protein [Streptomyces sp. I05A-00742]
MERLAPSPWALTARIRTASAEDSRGRADAQIAWLRDYAGRRVNSLLIDERRCIPPYIALDFGNAGLFGLLIEEEYGGQALRFADIARVLEQLAAIDVGLGTWHLTSVFPGTRALSAWGTPELKAGWLTGLASGRLLGAYGQTEPETGSDFTRITTRARPAPHGWTLSGHKYWVGNGSWASVATILCRLVDEQDAPARLVAFAVPLDVPGVRFGEEHLSLGLRGMVQSGLTFDTVALDRSLLLGEGEGIQVAVDSMAMTRFALAAAALGATRRVLQLALRFSTRRTLAGRRLCERTVTREALGEMCAYTAIGESLVYGLAEQLDQGRPVALESVTAAKVMTSEWLGQAADRLLQLLGGRGYDEANPAARLYRDVRVYRIFEGATEALLDFLGTRALTQPERIAALIADEQVAARLAEALAAGPATDHDRQRALAGPALAWAFAVAAVRARPPSGPHAAAVAEARFAQALRDVRSGGGPRTVAVMPPEELTSTVAAYSDRIGDLEQSLPGERTVLDPLLGVVPRA